LAKKLHNNWLVFADLTRVINRMRVAFDTNAIIKLCKSDDLTSSMVTHLTDHPTDSLILLSYAVEEFETKASAQELINFTRLEGASVRDYQRYFTIGVSYLDGPDVLRGDSAMADGIQKEVYDIKSAYEEYVEAQRENGNPVKDVKKWLAQNNHQADAVIYERAAELSCDHLVTMDDRIKRVVPRTHSCSPIAFDDFMQLIGGDSELR
jgi:hypothetical protein